MAGAVGSSSMAGMMALQKRENKKARVRVGGVDWG